MLEIVLSIVLVLFFIFLQGFFSSCEMSFVSTNKIKLQRKAKQNDKRAKIVLTFLNNPDKFLSTTLVGLNISVVAASSITSYVIAEKIQLSQMYQALISTLIISPIIFLFGQLTPMSLGREFSYIYPYKISLLLKYVYYILSPIVYICRYISAFITKLFYANSEKSPYVTKEEIKYLLKESYATARTHFKKDIKTKMLTEVIDFSETTAKEVMIPLIDALLISSDYSKEQILEIFNIIKRDKVPVYTERVDNIIGILDITDFWLNFNTDISIENYLISPYFVPENKLVDELLEELKKTGKFTAIVVDEFGGASGIVYFDTIVSELIAELKTMGNESKSDFKEIIKINVHTYKIAGTAKIDMINEELGIDIPENGYTNINGFLTNKVGRILQENEEFIFNNNTFKVIKSSAKKIKEVIIILGNPL